MKKFLLCLSFLITSQVCAVSHFAKIAFSALAVGGAAIVSQLSPFDLERQKLLLFDKVYGLRGCGLHLNYACEPNDFQEFLDEFYTSSDTVAVPKDSVKRITNSWPLGIGFDALYHEMVRIQKAKVPFYKRIKSYMSKPSQDIVNVIPEFPVIIKKRAEFNRHFQIENSELQYVVVPKKLLMKIYYNIIMSPFVAQPRIPLYTPYLNGKPISYGIDNEISLEWCHGIRAYEEWKNKKKNNN